MAYVAKDASEKKFQDNFVKELQKYKWSSPDSLNGNIQKVTVDDLITFWRSELNRLNADQLEGIELTDDEFKQVISKVNLISNSYEAAKVLAMENSTGKIDGIYRDPNPKVTRTQITLTIFKKAEVRGGDSSYRIAREVSTSHGNRFDIVMLINGLPLINIEQKRSDVSLDEAFNQFKRYYADGEYTNNFMAFSQMMVITSEIETRYFATPKSIKDFNTSFEFHWADKDNRPVNNWQEVIEKFLMIPMAHQMVGDYLVIDEAENVEDRRHMVMRPYQVYALQAVEGAAFGWDNGGIAHGGFVWHTTGSGKTITSFKTALFLSTRAGFDKVVFLVDRRELDKNTSKNFKAYASYEPVEVDATKYTHQLKALFKDPGIVVTTTFKLSSYVNELIENGDDSLKEKKIVFIIDEAHRTTMGRMMKTITDYFKKNGLFYGFTGTPLFDENNAKGMINDDSETIKTTQELFGPLLHKYTIDQAIADGNVLGFHVDYVNTGEFLSYDELRDKLLEVLIVEHPDKKKRDLEREVVEMSEAKVEEECSKRLLLTYNDKTHIPVVVSEILDNWENQSHNREFNALLTVANIKRVVKYYYEFKKQMKESGKKINIAMTFSSGNENDTDTVPEETVKEMLKDYAEFTGISFEATENSFQEDPYFEDLIDRTKRGGSGRNAKNIDLVIVADRMLTGYDSRYLNTLYVDRMLELQGLIQAYSRTNRVLGSSKEFGSIINYKYPRMTEEAVNAALRLYGSGGTSSRALMPTYADSVRMLAADISIMVTCLPDPTAWQDIKNDEQAKKEFIAAYREASKQLNFVSQYYEYCWDDAAFGISEHTWLQYVGAYKNLKPDSPDQFESDDPLEGKVRLVGVQEINASYIISLIGKQITKNGEIQAIDDETKRIIYEQIQELSNMGDHIQAELLRQFVDEIVIPGKTSKGESFDVAYENWKKSGMIEEIHRFADQWGVDCGILERAVDSYSLNEPNTVPYIDEIVSSVDYERALNKEASNILEHNMNLTEALPKWVVEVKKKF